MSVMFWIERREQTGGFYANTPHWNRILGNAHEATIRGDFRRLKKRTPSDKFRLVKVTEEVIEA